MDDLFDTPAGTTGTSRTIDPPRRPQPRQRTRRWGAIAISGALLGVVGAPTAVGAGTSVPPTSGPSTSEPTTSQPSTSQPSTSQPVSTEVRTPDPAAPVVAPATFTLPLFGGGLTVDITTGPGGSLASVMVNPADGFTAATARPNKVAFVNADGVTSVVVSSRHGGQRVEGRAGSLAEIVGPGGWSGEVFPGVPASVSFEIVDNGGVPGIVVGAVTPDTAEVGSVEVSTDRDDDRDDDSDGDGDVEHEARVKIRFSSEGQSRWLTIRAEVEIDGNSDDSDDSDGSDGSDGGTEAKVRISLSRIKASFTDVGADSTGGPQTWSGVLCDGTPATIAFSVVPGANSTGDATITIDSVSPAPERQKVDGNGVDVRFGDGERVRLRLRNADGTTSVRVDEQLRCRNAPDPTLNVPVSSADADDDDDSDRRDDSDDSNDSNDSNDSDDSDDSDDDKPRDRRGRGGDGRTASTVPTATTIPTATTVGGSDDAGQDDDSNGSNGSDDSNDADDGDDD